MAEWSNAPVLKTDELRGSGGSNPSLSATRSSESHCSFFLWQREGFVQSVASRQTCLRLAIVCSANLCPWLMLLFESELSVYISQCQQSPIAIASLRSALDCCARSNLVVLETCLRSSIVCFANLCPWLMFLFAIKQPQIAPATPNAPNASNAPNFLPSEI